MAGKDAETDDRPFDHPIRTSAGLDLAAAATEVAPGASGDGEFAAELALGAKPLTTPKLRLQAVHAGAGAAGILAAMNLLGAMGAWSRPVQSLIGPDPGTHAAAQLIAAAVAGGLALLIYTRAGLWACEVVLAWSLLELDPWLMHWLYGHGWRDFRLIQLVVICVLLAAVGVHGAWSIRLARRAEGQTAVPLTAAAGEPAAAAKRAPTVE